MSVCIKVPVGAVEYCKPVGVQDLQEHKEREKARERESEREQWALICMIQDLKVSIISW